MTKWLLGGFPVLSFAIAESFEIWDVEPEPLTFPSKTLKRNKNQNNIEGISTHTAIHYVAISYATHNDVGVMYYCG